MGPYLFGMFTSSFVGTVDSSFVGTDNFATAATLALDGAALAVATLAADATDTTTDAARDESPTTSLCFFGRSELHGKEGMTRIRESNQRRMDHTYMSHVSGSYTGEPRTRSDAPNKLNTCL